MVFTLLHTDASLSNFSGDERQLIFADFTLLLIILLIISPLNSSLLFLDLSCLHSNLCPYSFSTRIRVEMGRETGGVVERRDQPITQRA